MDLVLKGMQFKYFMVYINNICTSSSTFEQHLQHLQEVFQSPRPSSSYIQENANFPVQEVHYLGHVLTPKGIKPNPDKVREIKSFPIPSKIKHLRLFLGMIGY